MIPNTTLLTAREKEIVFYVGYYDKDNQDPLDWASKKGYRDMQRTLTYRPNPKSSGNLRENWRKGATKLINLSSINGSFDKWHEKTCNDLINYYKTTLNRGQSILVQRNSTIATDLTLGQAQKWLNMTLKHLWLLDRLHLLDDIKNPMNKEIRSFIKTYEKDFHVPLDSYLIRYIKREQKGNKKFPGNGLSQVHNMHGLNGNAWSKISIKNYKDYLQDQVDIRTDLAAQGILPLKWELKHWPVARVYY